MLHSHLVPLRKFLPVLLAGVVVCLAPLSAAAQAPAAATAPNPRDIVGTWQGTLHIPQANRDLRILNKISRTDKGELKVLDYSIDQGSQAMPADKATFEDGVLKYEITGINGKYEGKMSPDGKSIAGNWTQGGGVLALNLDRANDDTAWAIPAPPKPMAADANPGFDVATIKPSVPNRPGKGFGYDGHHFRTMNTNVNDLVAFAYGLHDKQIVNSPDWFGADLFDIEGVPDTEGVPNQHQMQIMVQKLLVDRFKLKYHNEKRELSVYVLGVAGSAPKIKETSAGPNDLPAFFFRQLGDLTVRNMSMKDFATWMQTVLDKPVVDQTGLKGRYDFQLKWTPDDSQFASFRGTGAVVPPPSEDPNAPPSLYTAIQEQDGLKMSPGKAQDDVIVIDHAEKPTAN